MKKPKSWNLSREREGSSWREEAAVSARDQLLQTQVGGRKLLSAPEISYCKLKLEGGSCCQRQR